MRRSDVSDARSALAALRLPPVTLRTRLLASLLSGLFLAIPLVAHAQGEEGGATGGEPLLPDLQVLPPSGFYVVPANADGVVRLKFTTTIWNAGPGLLEVRGAEDELTGELLVHQVFFTEDGELVPGEPVGTFDFEHRHGHLHLSDFARYELWSVAADGSLQELVAENDKVGFCLMDNILVDGDRTTGDGEPRYPTECEGEAQGISPGYGDVYVAQLFEQDIDITGVADGRYAVVNIANPTGVITEVTLENNAATAYIVLEGDEVRPD